MKKFGHWMISILLITCMFMQSGCFGSFGVTRQLYQWNSSVEDKTVRSVLFFVLCVIPVYPVAVVADWMIFNVIEYWEGTNPLSLRPGEQEEQRVVVRGRHFRMEATAGRMKVFEARKGAEVLMGEYRYEPVTHTWKLRTAGRDLSLVRFVKTPAGFVEAEVFVADGSTRTVPLHGGSVAWSTVPVPEPDNLVARR